MGLKKRSKVSAEFNMSSLTDIIFLLLIFFMLTSSLVAPNAMNLKLPGQSQTNVVSDERLDDVRIDRNGELYLNNKKIDLARLEDELRRRQTSKRGQMTMTISPDTGAPVEGVVSVMDIALRLDIDGILAPKEQ